MQKISNNILFLTNCYKPWIEDACWIGRFCSHVWRKAHHNFNGVSCEA